MQPAEPAGCGRGRSWKFLLTGSHKKRTGLRRSAPLTQQKGSPSSSRTCNGSQEGPAAPYAVPPAPYRISGWGQIPPRASVYPDVKRGKYKQRREG